MAVIDQAPPLPISMDDFVGWRNYLQYINGRIAQSTQDATPPALVTGLTLRQVYPGVLVSWTPTLKATNYFIYRNTTAMFSTATPIIQLVGNGNVSYFDVTQALGNVTLYYWVQAANDLGILGPVSAQVSTANSMAPAGGLIPGVRDGSVFALAIPDDDLPQFLGAQFSDMTGGDIANNVTFWSNSYEDEDFYVWSGSPLQDYTLP